MSVVLTQTAPTTAGHSDAPRLRHVPILDPLRGLAALTVCLYHFTNGNDALLAKNDPVRQLCYFGHYGVEAFFVVSGFVIPYSQLARNHRWGDFGTFMLRRLKRLEPPYLACIALVLILNLASSIAPGFRGAAASNTWPQLAAHFAYANAFLGYKWLNPVFWTLAIEFQFYLLMACVFPFVAHPSLAVRLTTSGCLAAAAWLGNGTSSCIPHWLPVFLVGITAFQAVVGLLPFGFAAALFAAIAVLFAPLLGHVSMGAAVATAAVILACTHAPIPRWLSPLAWTGVISYSLYLVHVPIGMRVVNLAVRWVASQPSAYLVVLWATVTSIVSAWLFWRFVEKPSAAWAKPSPVPRRA